MIALKCPQCDKRLDIPTKMIGRKVACPKCYHGFVVPAKLKADENSLETNQKIALVQASSEEIVKELARRGHCAVLTIVKEARESTPTGDEGSSLLGLLGSGLNHGFGVKHLTTEPMDQERLATLFRLFAKLQDKERSDSVLSDDVLSGTKNSSADLSSLSAISAAYQNSSKESQSNEPLLNENIKPIPKAFTLKENPLGMTLAEFKVQYARPSLIKNRDLPWCSDESPGFNISELMTSEWHYAAKIVHARIDLPDEKLSPTIAGVQTDHLIFQFVDEKLFQITGFFTTDGFHTVADALRRKFGTAISEGDDQRKLMWWSLDSTIELKFGRLHPSEPSCIRYYHDDLFEIAADRMPTGKHDL